MGISGGNTSVSFHNMIFLYVSVGSSEQNGGYPIEKKGKIINRDNNRSDTVWFFLIPISRNFTEKHKKKDYFIYFYMHFLPISISNIMTPRDHKSQEALYLKKENLVEKKNEQVFFISSS